MQFPIEYKGIKIGHWACSGYFVCIPYKKGHTTDRYIYPDGSLRSDCSGGWHKRFRDAAITALRHLHGDGAMLLISLISDEELYGFLSPSTRTVKVATVHFLCDDEAELQSYLEGWDAGYEFRMSLSKPAVVPADNPWDVFFNKGEDNDDQL